MVSNATVAICFSGLIRLGIPDEGASVRHNLVNALSADAFMAATYTADDACATAHSSHKHLQSSRRKEFTSRCLLHRVRRAGPFVGVTVRPMLSGARLASLMNRTVPHFATVKRFYKEERNWNGLNVFTPVLGNDGLSVLREWSDYSRSYQQVEAHERLRGANYSWWIFGRVEMLWLAPHVPLSLLSPQLVWVPSRGEDGVNDRHAAVPRRVVAKLTLTTLTLTLTPNRSSLAPATESSRWRLQRRTRRYIAST